MATPAQQRAAYLQRQRAASATHGHAMARARAKPRATINPPKPTTPARPASGAAPATPAAPAAPLGLPPDPLYEAAVAALGKTQANTVSGLQTQRTGTLAGYGYNEDPITRALSFDPNNPYSKASLLKGEWDRSRATSRQTMGAGGQLYAGAMQNTQDYLNRGQLGAEDALQKSLGAWLAQNTSDIATAGSTYEQGVGQADIESIGRLQDRTNPLYSPTAAARTTAKKPASKPAFRTQSYTSPSGAKGVLHIYPDGRKVFVKS